MVGRSKAGVWQILSRYLTALGAVGLALLVRCCMTPLVADRVPFLTVFPAIVFAAWYCGKGPALAATIASALGVTLTVLQPYEALRSEAPYGYIGIIFVLGFGLFCVYVFESLRKAQEMAGRQRRELEAEVAHRKEVEQQLRRSEQLLRTTFRSIGDAVVTTDASGCVTFLNPVAEELTGWSLGDAIGKPLGEVFRIVNAETRATVESPVERVLREGTIVGLANHTVLIARDGTEHPIDDSAAPIREPNGEIIGVVMVFHDVSIRYEAERSREETNRRKDEFLAVLAHELRNPLAPIRNAVEMMRTEYPDPKQFQAQVEVIGRQVSQLVRLVDDLLNVNRINTARLELRREIVDLATIVANAVETCMPIAQSAGHRVHVELPSGPVFVNADPARLSQMLGNLLMNACKFTPDRGEITLRAVVERSILQLSVRDNGIGIPPENLQTIFEMFAQVPNSKAFSLGGLGIGLALVKRLVELHGGTLEVRSDGLGKGSEFRLLLPIVTTQTNGVGKNVPGSAPAHVAARRILVVDDNRDSADSLAMLLSRKGNEVIVSYDGAEAIFRFKEMSPEIVILDIGLPDLSGYDVCREMRQLAAGRDVTIVALTGWGQDEARTEATAAGFDHHLVKPVELAVLDDLLKRCGTTKV